MAEDIKILPGMAGVSSPIFPGCHQIAVLPLDLSRIQHSDGKSTLRPSKAPGFSSFTSIAAGYPPSDTQMLYFLQLLKPRLT